VRPPDARRETAAAIAEAQANLERALAELNKLPALDASSVALTAHALNNFLTVSRAVVEFLTEALRDYPDAQVRTWLDGLAHSTLLMTHAVSQLMSRSASGPTTLRIDDIQLPRLVERACTYYRRSAALKDIQVVFRADGDLPTVQTDGVLVAAILDNLLSNAVKYSPHGGHIGVDVRRVADGVTCSVQDDGPGLSDAEQARLFQPGARLGPVPSAGEPSSGYGLAIAKRFADQLGGALTCASAPGLGATFSLWLPGAGERRPPPPGPGSAD
jgi:signal transduction histidine kinase